MSQSELKLLAHSPNLFFNRIDRPNQRKRFFDLGTAVDLAMVKGITGLTKNLGILPARPNGQFYTLAEMLVNENLEPTEENILYGREALGINKYLKDDTVFKKFEEVQWYYDTLIENKDKVLLTEAELDDVIRIHNSFTTSKRTRQYFTPSENVKRFGHVQIDYTYEGVECKAELDIVDVDFENKTIQPYDIKTIGKETRKFRESVIKRRYDIQAASYTIALLELVDDRATSPQINIDLSRFVVLPFIFLVETTISELIGVAPMPYKASPELLRAGLYGVYQDKRFTVTGPPPNVLFSSTPLIPGFHSLIQDYKWYQTRPEEDRAYTRLENEQMDKEDAVILFGW